MRASHGRHSTARTTHDGCGAQAGRIYSVLVEIDARHTLDRCHPRVAGDVRRVSSGLHPAHRRKKGVRPPVVEQSETQGQAAIALLRAERRGVEPHAYLS